VWEAARRPLVWLVCWTLFSGRYCGRGTLLTNIGGFSRRLRRLRRLSRRRPLISLETDGDGHGDGEGDFGQFFIATKTKE